MKINRRFFNYLLGCSSLTFFLPKGSFGDNYTGPVNWAGVSFLLPFNQIEILMPIDSNLFTFSEAFTSEPVILNPRLLSSSAIPLIPIPPIPTKWMDFTFLNI